MTPFMPLPPAPGCADLLAQASAQNGLRVIVTGAIGAGKTTWCAGLIAYARAQGWSVAGVSSPGVFADGQKIAIDLLDLATGQRRRLANRRSTPDPASPTPNWAFAPDVLAWGDALLRGIDRADLLVIDELGPLELQHDQGWVAALPLLHRQAYRLACVVVRPSLLTLMQVRLVGAVPAGRDAGTIVVTLG